MFALLVMPGAAQALEQRLVAADGAPGDRLGRDVAVDGDTAVVGAFGDDQARGAVYVFTRVGDGWTQTAKLTASDGEPGDWLGYSVAIDGDTIVAGAVSDDVGAGGQHGSVYTFARTGAPDRAETAKLTVSDGAVEHLGGAVAIDGDTIVAGATGGETGQAPEGGAVYTFARTGPPARTETARLTASDPEQFDNLGTSVAIDGDTIVAGDSSDDGASTISHGAVYTFATMGPAERTETAKLTASDGAELDTLGTSVAIDGDTIVAGAPGADIGANGFQGSLYTFARTGAPTRTETAKLTASDGARLDQLGESVATDGDTIVAGAPEDDIGANLSQGSLYTFARTGAPTRSETGKLVASDGAASDRLGAAVAIDGDTFLAGAAGRLFAPHGQGSAVVFYLPAPVGTTLTGHPAIFELIPGVQARYRATATLAEAASKAPIAGRTVRFHLPNGTPLCEDETDAAGFAQCTGVEAFLAVVLAGGYFADFEGDDEYLSSHARGRLIRVATLEL